MTNDADTARLGPDPAQVELLLSRIEGSEAFRGSARHRALLRHLVERTLAGDLASLKETVLAVEVFGRAADRFDPRTDSIVRVETRRLRQRLISFFRVEGGALPLQIDLPVGSYVPQLVSRSGAAGHQEASRRARDLVERGQYLLREALGEAPLVQALERFQAALAESPDYVPALVGAGRAWYNLAVGWYREPSIAAEHAAEALRVALQRDPSHAEAHVLLGAIVYGFERDWPAAERSFERALAHAPGSAFVHSAFGSLLLSTGQFERAERHLQQARRLDPMYLKTRLHMVNLRLAQRRLADAEAELEGLLDIAPQSMPAAGMAGLLAMERGAREEAVAHLRRACALAPGHANATASLAAALGHAGRHDEADALMTQLLAERGPQAVSPYVLAVVAARAGRSDAAFAHLRQALDEGDPSAPLIATDPSLGALHDDARWPGLVAASREPRRRAVRSAAGGASRGGLAAGATPTPSTAASPRHG